MLTPSLLINNSLSVNVLTDKMYAVPVNIILDGQRERVVDDKVHPGDVEASGRHISGHQQRDLPRLELLHRLGPPVLHNSEL